MKESIQAYVLQGDAKNVQGELKEINSGALPQGDVTVRVAYSTINYKDAMIAKGVGRMVRKFPHVPGIDLVGTVEADSSGKFKEGQRVIVTSYDLGVGWWGGYAEYACVPAEWVVPLPEGLTEWEAMALGTAGLTAMLSLMALERNGVKPGSGPVLVTGATGGVGSVGIDILSGAGYTVAASSGKADMHPFLKELGAGQILSREDVNDDSGKPLLAETWAGAIDNAGGETLSYLLRTAKTGGSVALCGLVQSPDLNATVYPFILRGVNLLGIDSVNCPMDVRTQAWKRLAGENKPRHLREIGRTISFEDLPGCLEEILAGGARGRYVVQIAA